MKLARKESYKPVYQEKPKEYHADGNLSQSQKDLFDIDMQGVCDRGKYKGKTLEWVKKNDSSYWQWILDNDIAYEWLLITLKGSRIMKKPKKQNMWEPFITLSGECWMGLRWINEPGIEYKDIDNI